VFDARRDVLTYQGNAPAIGSVLTWMDTGGQTHGTIGERRLNWDAAISPDGKQIAIARGNPDPSVFLYDVDRQIDARLTSDGSFSRAPVWSPDGSRIAYASIRENGRLNVYVVPTDRSSAPAPVVVDDVDMIPGSWSSDGRHLLVDYGDPGETEIWVLNMTGEPEPKPVVQTRPWAYNGVFSPDGKYIAYTSREEGEDEVFVIAYPGPGTKVKVSNRGGASPSWSNDMTKLFFRGYQANAELAAFERSDGILSFSTPRTLFRISYDSSLFIQSDNDLKVAPNGWLLCKVADEVSGDIVAITLVIGWVSDVAHR